MRAVGCDQIATSQLPLASSMDTSDPDSDAVRVLPHSGDLGALHDTGSDFLRSRSQYWLQARLVKKQPLAGTQGVHPLVQILDEACRYPARQAVHGDDFAFRHVVPLGSLTHG